MSKNSKSINLSAIVFFVLLFSLASFSLLAGFVIRPLYNRYFENSNDSAITENTEISTSEVNWKHFKGNNYRISYLEKWGVSGPYEAPISGFPEYLKLISPSGDLHINIGLKGDGRFTAVDEAVIQSLNSFPIQINNKEYIAEESFLLLGGSEDSNGVDMVTLSVTLEDVTKLGTAITGTYDVFQPMRIQVLYRMPKSAKTSEGQLEAYSEERSEALEILKTFRAY